MGIVFSDSNSKETKKILRKKFLAEIEEILNSSDNEGVTLIPPFESSKLNFWERLALKLTNGVGSWPFTIILAILVATWFFWNGHPIMMDLRFDEFPFIFLNLALSSIAAFQAPIILMAQNAQYKRDLQRDDYHYEIQVVAEAELRAAHSRLSNIELDLAVLTEETSYVQDNTKRELKDINDKLDRLADSTSEYKNRVDTIAENMKTIHGSLEIISTEHIKLITNMFETIKSSKEMTNERRAPSSTNTTPTGGSGSDGSKGGKPARYRAKPGRKV